MKKKSFWLFVIAVVVTGGLLLKPARKETIRVPITLNLDEARARCYQVLDEKGVIIAEPACPEWYWVQFHLTAGGDLRAASNVHELWESYKRWGHTYLFKVSLKGGKIYVGKFTSAETIPERYVFLPTQDLGKNVQTLTFFAKDGSIWIIPVPRKIQNPQRGETETMATVFR